jgi:hypothetical protein
MMAASPAEAPRSIDALLQIFEKHFFKVSADFGDLARALPMSEIDYCTSVAPVVSALLAYEKEVMLGTLFAVDKISFVSEVLSPDKVLEVAQFMECDQYQQASERAKSANLRQVALDIVYASLQARRAARLSDCRAQYKPMKAALTRALIRLREAQEADESMINAQYKSLGAMPHISKVQVEHEALRLYTERLQSVGCALPSPVSDLHWEMAQVSSGRWAHAHLVRKHLDTPSTNHRLVSDIENEMLWKPKEEDEYAFYGHHRAARILVSAGAEPIPDKETLAERAQGLNREAGATFLPARLCVCGGF